MERQAWKLIVLLLLFCYVHSPYVKAQVGNGKQITMEWRCVKMRTFFFLSTKPRLSQAGALLLPKDFVSLGIRFSL